MKSVPNVRRLLNPAYDRDRTVINHYDARWHASAHPRGVNAEELVDQYVTKYKHGALCGMFAYLDSHCK